MVTAEWPRAVALHLTNIVARTQDAGWEFVSV